MPDNEFHIRGRIIAASNEIADGVVSGADSHITSVRSIASWTAANPALPQPDYAGTILPGLVDIHNHGGGGRGFDSTDLDAAREAASYHHRRGSTTVLASLVTASLPALQHQLRRLRPLFTDRTIAGIHCEGPFLAASRCGAHDPRLLCDPSPQAARDLLGAAAGTLRVITIAPELPGFAATAKVFADAGTVVAAGHSAASFAGFTAALAPAGPATLVTHLANGMPPMHHRAAGPVAASLRAAARGAVITELICDGVHVSAEFAQTVFALVPGRIAVVSDALAAAGMPDGRYQLGPLAVHVREGLARTESGALAGGTSTALDALAWLVRECGVPLPAAVRAATLTPAQAVGLPDAGDLRPGMVADLVIVDDGLARLGVLRRGRWLR